MSTKSIGELRDLLLNWKAIEGDSGPGAVNNGRGSWHLFCHLAGAAAIYRMPNRSAAWVGILYDRSSRQYAASVVTHGRTATIVPARSMEGRHCIAHAKWCGYLEGASRGHILDRSARDAGDPRKVDRRQDYNQRINSAKDGGPVWEMWTVSRDIRASNRLGHSLIEAYSDLLQVLGGGFAAVVARGRMEPEYGHLRQMCAMIDAGFISPTEALTEIDAEAIPSDLERLLLEAKPKAFAEAATMLVDGRTRPCYFMYRRKISSFASASLLRRLSLTLARPSTRRR